MLVMQNIMKIQTALIRRIEVPYVAELIKIAPSIVVAYAELVG